MAFHVSQALFQLTSPSGMHPMVELPRDLSIYFVYIEGIETLLEARSSFL